ncbi:MAG: hypothetical protein KBF71_04195 [Alphaproteobacteria bacterium]|nr:hypothetical protein [Alphaproteobacteria bacterium]
MTIIYATLYYDTEAKEYRNFNGANAVPYMVKASQDSATFREVKGLWSEILSYLGQEAINMRKVCSFFLYSDFQTLYERSPIHLSSRDEGFREALRARTESLTNVSLSLNKYSKPLIPSLDLHLILPRMARLTALPRVKFDPQIFADSQWLSLVQSLVHGDLNFDFGHILNQAILPNLQKLKLLFAPQYVNLDFLDRLSHSTLRCFEWKLCDKQSIDLSLLVTLLRAMPQLETWKIHCNNNSLTGAFEIEPNSLLNLKNCEMTGLHWTSEDFAHFIAAARHLVSLRLTYFLVIKGVFKTLEAGDLPFLRKMSITNTDQNFHDIWGLCRAAPKLEELNWVPGDHARVDQRVPADLSYPQIRRAHFVPASNTEDGTPFWDMLEQMPNLEDLSMRNANLLSVVIEQCFANAYVKLTSLHLYDCEIPASYLTALFNHALHLQRILIDGGHIKLASKELQEKALQSLQSLWMQSVRITERDLYEILKRATKLEDFTFRHSYLLRQKGPSFDLPANSMSNLKSLESSESSYKNDCLSQEQVVSFLKAAPNLEKLKVPDRYLFALNLFETGALSSLKKVDFWYKSVTPEVRARLVEIIQRVAPNVTIDKSNG